MPATIAQLAVDVTANTDKAQKGLADINDTVSKAPALFKGAAIAVGAFVGAGLAIGTVFAGALVYAIKQASDSNVLIAQTNQLLLSTHDASGMSAQGIDDLTNKLEALMILLAGQLEEGRVDVDATATDLRPLVDSVLASTRLRTPVDIELRVYQNGDRAVALADEDKLRQVLVNLLDNAIKYSPDGGEVAVELAGGAGRVRLTVRDQGIGVPAGEQERIFEKFYRLDPALTRGVGGSGLGLFISRELVTRMGGSLTVRSRPGEGAAFVVDLPAA